MKKLVSYLRALWIVMTTILVFTGVKYNELNNTKDILIYALLTGNLVVWSFYYIYKFLKEMNE